MKNKNVKFFVVLALMVSLSVLSFRLLSEKPITVFTLENGSPQATAFTVRIYFATERLLLQPITLNPAQALIAHQIILDKNLDRLKTFAKNFGNYNFFIGFSNAQDDFVDNWNHFFGFHQGEGDSFSNLGAMDKFYLTLSSHTRIGESGSSVPATALPLVPISTQTLSPTMTISPTPVVVSMVRVEILNGCGIKGAVSWVASRLANADILVKNGGNAHRFSYSKSMLLSSTDIPPIFEGACQRLGFSKLVVRKGMVPRGCDLVFIIGRDFRKIKRENHGTHY